MPGCRLFLAGGQEESLPSRPAAGPVKVRSSTRLTKGASSVRRRHGWLRACLRREHQQPIALVGIRRRHVRAESKVHPGMAAAGFNNNVQDQQTQRQNADRPAHERDAAGEQPVQQPGLSAGDANETYLRSLPLNEINALRTGSQVQGPQFGQYYTNNANAAPIMDAGIAQGNYNLSPTPRSRPAGMP